MTGLRTDDEFIFVTRFPRNDRLAPLVLAVSSSRNFASCQLGFQNIFIRELAPAKALRFCFTSASPRYLKKRFIHEFARYRGRFSFVLQEPLTRESARHNKFR